MLAEQQTEWVINNNLANKGWNVDANSKLKNVYFQKPPYKDQQEKLNGKRPDYILYQTGTDRPIAIIEAKKSGVNLDPALAQGAEYAKILDAPLVFAMNGAYCETLFVPNNKELILNGEEVRELIREKEVLQFLNFNTNEAWTIPPEVKVSRDELISKFRSLNDVLRSEGLRAGIERFSEFANILFLKLLSEEGQKSWWNSIKSQSSDDIISYINGYVINQIKSTYGGDVFTPISIKNPQVLRHIIDAIDPLVLSTIKADIKGDAFEYFLEKTTSTENDLGEYFTPRNIVKTIINLVAPKFKESVYDPFCGTGGFLTEAFNYIKDNNIIEGDEDLERLKFSTLYGREITTTARIAKMNLILHGDGHSGIQQINTLTNPDYVLPNGEIKKFDIVITNMPFSQTITRKIAKNGKTKTENHISSLYYNGIAKNNGDAACILHCLRALKEGGRMVLVVPEGFLFRKDIANVRKFLLSKAKLQSVISLPQGAFLPYTGVKTSILYFTNAHKSNDQKNYWFFETKNIGVTLDKRKRKINGDNDLKKIESSDIKKVDDKPELKDNMLETGFEIVDLDKVKNNDYNLVGNSYRKDINEISDIKLFSQLLDDGLIQGEKGKTITKAKAVRGNIPVIAGGQTSPYPHDQSNFEGNVITISASGAYAGFVWYHNDPIWASDCSIVYSGSENKLITKYLYYILKSQQEKIYKKQRGSGQPHIYLQDLSNIKIPLPSLEKQRGIVDELDSYQKIVNGLKQAVDNWKPFFEVNESWEILNIDRLCSLVQRGKSPKYGDSRNQVIKSGQAKGFFEFDFTNKYYVSNDFKLDHRQLVLGDVLINSTGVGTCGRVTYFALGGGFLVDSHITILRVKQSLINPKYLLYYLGCIYGFKAIENMAQGSSGKIELNLSTIKDISIFVPPLDIQQEIVKQLEKERVIIEQQKEIIKLFQQKMQNKLNSIWQSDKECEYVADKSVFSTLIKQASKTFES